MTWGAFLAALRSAQQHPRVAQASRRAVSTQTRSNPKPTVTEAVETIQTPATPPQNEAEETALVIDEFGEPWALAPTW